MANESRGLALAHPASVLPTRDEWALSLEMGESFLRSGLLPTSIKTAAAAVLLIQKGRELGLPPTMALAHLHVINGVISTDAQVIAGLIYRDHGDAALIPLESTAKVATYAYKRRGWAEAQRYSYSIGDAERAGLTGKDNWRRHPASMLRARCVSAIGHMAFQDSIGGLYVDDEAEEIEPSRQPVMMHEAPVNLPDVTPDEDETVTDGDYQPVQQPAADEPTERQLRMLHGIARQAWPTDADRGLRAFLTERFGTEHSNELDRRQMSQAIDEIKAAMDESTARTQAVSDALAPERPAHEIDRPRNWNEFWKLAKPLGFKNISECEEVTGLLLKDTRPGEMWDALQRAHVNAGDDPDLEAAADAAWGETEAAHGR